MPSETPPPPEGNDENDQVKDPKAPYGSRSTQSELEVHQIQDFADEVAEIANIGAPYGIKFRLQIDAGTEGKEIPDDVLARLNEALQRVSEDLKM